MKLDYAILAADAQRLHDGRLSIWGCEADQISCNSLPTLIQATLVVKVLIFPDEPIDGRTIRVELTPPSGKSHALIDTELEASRNSIFDDEPGGVVIQLNLSLGVKNAGKYVFTVITDGIEAKKIPLLISVDPTIGANTNAHANVAVS